MKSNKTSLVSMTKEKAQQMSGDEKVAQWKLF